MNRHWTGPRHPVLPRVREQGGRFWLLLAGSVLLAALFFGSFAYLHWTALVAEHETAYRPHTDHQER